MSVKRGELYWVDLDPTKGSEQAGRRPVLVIQNNIGNERAATTIIAPLTTRSFTREYPTNVHLVKGECGLNADSTILLSQIRTIDKSRLDKRIGALDRGFMSKVNQAIKVSLALT
jgi:mRNA interferase MazF